MISPTDSRCYECWKQGTEAHCFPVRTSRLEQALLNERFQCERCHTNYLVQAESIVTNETKAKRGEPNER